MRCDYVEIMFMGNNYGINLKSNSGLDDLVYDMKLNEAIDGCFPVKSIRDLKEQFDDGLIHVSKDCGYKKNLFS